MATFNEEILIGFGVQIGGESPSYNQYPLRYRIEFSQDENTRSDSAAYIHIRQIPPIYQTAIDKEDYETSLTKHPFITGIFNISGVCELSVKAYRIWLVKSPIFTWQEVLTPVLLYLANWFQNDSIVALPGSADLDGKGFILPSPLQRRKL
jgi:hypothetical protein